MKKYLFAPGCALILYKPHLAEKIHNDPDQWHKELDEFIEIHKDPETEIIKK